MTTSDGWPLPPKPVAAQPAPSSLAPDRMVFTVGSKTDDTNGNGFGDLIKASVSLFSSEHPTALMQEGTFVFTLHARGLSNDAETKPMAEWRINTSAIGQGGTQVMCARTVAGPSYLFQLSLLDLGRTGDVLPLDRADMVCRFEPAGKGPVVHSSGVRTLQIGKRSTLSAR